MWSYEPQLVTDKDQVRFLIQDTNDSRHLFQDEEINWILSQEANIYMASAAMCDILIARAGNVRSKKVGELTITYDPMFYRTLRIQLASRGMGHQIPYAGGISIADKLGRQNDSDRTPPTFARNMEDNPGAPQPKATVPDPLTSI